MHIHIFGASGAGVTTLGEALAQYLSIPYFDTDQYYWLPSDPPFQHRQEPALRNQRLTSEALLHPNWIIGGSLLNWGDHWFSMIDLAIFLWVPPTIRIERLKKRELSRYGPIILTDPNRHQQHQEFIDWASGYDDGSARGRTLAAHEHWMGQLTCPVIALRGEQSVTERLTAVRSYLTSLAANR